MAFDPHQYVLQTYPFTGGAIAAGTVTPPAPVLDSGSGITLAWRAISRTVNSAGALQILWQITSPVLGLDAGATNAG